MRDRGLGQAHRLLDVVGAKPALVPCDQGAAGAAPGFEQVQNPQASRVAEGLAGQHDVDAGLSHRQGALFPGSGCSESVAGGGTRPPTATPAHSRRSLKKALDRSHIPPCRPARWVGPEAGCGALRSAFIPSMKWRSGAEIGTGEMKLFWGEGVRGCPASGPSRRDAAPGSDRSPVVGEMRASRNWDRHPRGRRQAP